MLWHNQGLLFNISTPPPGDSGPLHQGALDKHELRQMEWADVCSPAPGLQGTDSEWIGGPERNRPSFFLPTPLIWWVVMVKVGKVLLPVFGDTLLPFLMAFSSAQTFPCMVLCPPPALVFNHDDGSFLKDSENHRKSDLSERKDPWGQAFGR